MRRLALLLLILCGACAAPPARSTARWWRSPAVPLEVAPVSSDVRVMVTVELRLLETERDDLPRPASGMRPVRDADLLLELAREDRLLRGQGDPIAMRVTHDREFPFDLRAHARGGGRLRIVGEATLDPEGDDAARLRGTLTVTPEWVRVPFDVRVADAEALAVLPASEAGSVALMLKADRTLILEEQPRSFGR